MLCDSMAVLTTCLWFGWLSVQHQRTLPTTHEFRLPKLSVLMLTWLKLLLVLSVTSCCLEKPVDAVAVLEGCGEHCTAVTAVHAFEHCLVWMWLPQC